ncbi:autotransporter outer membrane beta-barrel domain-containing protein, partial [Bordetella genomosp. 1]
NSGVSTGERDLQPGVWGQYFGGRARQGERGDVAGFHARFGGMLVGADAQVSDNWRAGGMFSYAHTNVTNDQDNDGSSAKVDAYGLTAYAGYDGRPWYVNMMTGVVRQRYKSERDISYTGFSGNASGKYDGTQYVASVLAGYPIALGQRTTLTPLAGLSYSHLHQEGYTESGGNGAGLKVGSTSADSVKSDLGLKLEHVFDTSYGALTPNMQLRWRHEFVDSRVRTAASFAADPTGSTSFTSLGATPIKDTGVLVLGATLATRKNLTIGLNYTLEAASGYTSQTGDLRVRYAF